MLLGRIASRIPAGSSREAEVYSSDTMVVFRPDVLITEKTQFDDYHFVIPASPMPSLIVDRKSHEVVPGKLFFTNPNQTLAVAEERKIAKYTALFIDKDFLHDITRNIFKRPYFNFTNENISIDHNLMFQINQFITEAQIKQSGCQFMMESLAAQISINLLRNTKHNLTPQEYQYHINETSVNRAVEYIRSNFNVDFSMEDAAKAANYSPFHFIRVFKSQTGKTPYQFLIDVKIEKAAELLQGKDYNVTEIGMLCGFASTSHFNTIFKKKMGLSPTRYRKAIIGRY